VAALVATTPTVAGTTDVGAAVSASDTIDQSILGGRGAYLDITNAGGSSDTVTISDYGTTSAGNALPSNTYTVTVANGSSKVVWIRPGQQNPATGLVTVAHSFITTVTYELYPLQ
jgi:hypothetical protein